MRSYLGGPASVRLDMACGAVVDAFGDTCYLVGSATQGRDYRDVDVRLIMDDAKYEAVFGACPPSLSPLRSLLNVSISEHLSRATGLPVDFQIQKRSTVTREDWDKPRVPMGNRSVLRDSEGNSLGPAWIG